MLSILSYKKTTAVHMTHRIRLRTDNQPEHNLVFSYQGWNKVKQFEIVSESGVGQWYNHGYFVWLQPQGSEVEWLAR